MKTCKCGIEFVQYTSFQKKCHKCLVEDGRNKIRKHEKRETREKKKKLKTRGDWTKEAQIAFNRFIRARDNGLPCISCGRSTGAKVNAGHYRSVGSAPELRFTLFNVNLQCEHCNSHLSGNLINYRINLLDRVGADVVEWLEGHHEAKKYRIEELEEIKKGFNAWARELENDRER